MIIPTEVNSHSTFSSFSCKQTSMVTQSTSFDYISIGPTTSSYITSCKGSLGLFTSHGTFNDIIMLVNVFLSLKIKLPKTLQLKTLDFLQQTITMNENVQWQMIKDSVLFALSLGFSISLFHFYLKKKSTRGVLFCISSFFSFHRSLYLLLAYCLYWR
jgi:hypothetical protein